MATTFADFTGDGNATKAFSFPSIKEADIKVEVDGVIKTSGSHYNITSYTTTGGGNVVFTSGNIPSSPAAIRIFRDTDVDSAKATFTAGSSIKAGDLNNNMTQILYAAQEEQNQTILSSDIKDGAIKTVDIKDSNITTAKIADANVTTAKLADSNVTTAKIADSNVTTAKIADSNVTTAKIAADAVNGTKIADDSINSEHYVDGSIDTVHIANNQITTAKIANGAVDTAQLNDTAVTQAKIADAAVTESKIASQQVTGSRIANTAVGTPQLSDYGVTTVKIAAAAVTTDKIAASNVTTAKIADGGVTTAKIADLSVTTGKIANDAVTNTKIADNAVTNAKIADNSITAPKILNGSVGGIKIADLAVSTQKIIDSNVTTAKIADSAVTTPKIANNAIQTAKIADGQVSTAKIGGAQVTDAKLASNAVTTSKITDANVTTVKIADSNVTLAKLASDLKQTTISDSDTQLPTSGAVVDYVAAQIAPLGGLEVVATEVAFPNSQPNSGVVISISDAGGVVVNGSGVSTTGRTVGGSTVTINGFPSSLNNETLAAGVGLMVSSTGSSQTYNYHKILGKESDIKQLSDDINDFAERYRVGTTNPTSSNDAGDLFFNTTSSKLLVYNGSNSAWEEAQSIGQFFINTISSYSGTGGNSATFNGSAYRFVLSNPGANAEQHLVSINGVVQKPNSGTSQPSEGFAIDGSSIIFSSAPASNADFFIITIGASVNIGTPSANTVSTLQLANGGVTTAKIADDAVTTAKIADANVTTAKIADASITTSKIASQQVTGAKIANLTVGTSQLSDAGVTTAKLANGAVTDAKVNASAAIAGTKISPDFGSQNITTTGNLDVGDLPNTVTNSLLKIAIQDTDGTFKSDDNIKINPAQDVMKVSGLHLSSNHIRASNNGPLHLTTANANGTVDINVKNTHVEINGNLLPATDSTDSLGSNTVRWANLYADTLYGDGSNLSGINTDLVSDTSPQLGGDLDTNGHEISLDDNHKIKFGDSNDFHIKHDGANWIESMSTHAVHITVDNANDYAASFKANDAVELYYNGTKKFETRDTGAKISGTTAAFLEITTTSGSHNPMFRGSNGDRTFDTGLRGDSSDAWCVYDVTAADNRFMITTGGDVQIPNDNKALKIGAGQDLQIYHDGSSSYINNINNHTLIFMTNNGERWGIEGGGHFKPHANDSYDIGTSSYRVRNIYTNDLHLSNEGKTNDIDGTWGNWTIQEGESDLFLKNNRSGKKYKFSLTEVS